MNQTRLFIQYMFIILVIHSIGIRNTAANSSYMHTLTLTNVEEVSDHFEGGLRRCALVDQSSDPPPPLVLHLSFFRFKTFQFHLSHLSLQYNSCKLHSGISLSTVSQVLL